MNTGSRIRLLAASALLSLAMPVANAATIVYANWGAFTNNATYAAATVSPQTATLTTDDTVFTATPPTGMGIDAWYVVSHAPSASDIAEGTNSMAASSFSTTFAPSYTLTLNTKMLVVSSGGNYWLIPAYSWYGYTLAYNANGASGSAPASASHKYPDAFTLASASGLTLAGHSFGGWYRNAAGTGTGYPAGQSVSGSTFEATENGTITLYAKWTAIVSTVTLDAQGGSGGTSSVTATYGSAMPSITKPTRTGYTFGGYWTEANGKGTQYYYASGASARTWDKTSATTLYAKWTAKTSTVTLDAQGGSGGTSSVTATYDSALPTVVKPTRTGYTFGGYWTEPNAKGTKYYYSTGKGALTWDRTSATTLYAEWRAKTYEFTVDPNGGVYNSSSDPVVKDTPLKFGTSTWHSISPATRTGYSFAGWYSAASGGNRIWDASGAAEKGAYWSDTHANGGVWQYDAADGTFTTYAHWTARQYAVTFDLQGGSGGSSSVTATYDASLPSVNRPSRTGYTFAGYWTEPNGEGTQYYDSNGTGTRTWNIASTTTLYAKWSAKVYTFYVDPNGGVYSNSSEPVQKTPNLMYGSTRWWNISPAQRTGYDFTGWYSSSSGGSQVWDASGNAVKGDYWSDTHDNGGVWRHDAAGGSFTTYAQWSPSSYGLMFDAQGGSGGTSSVTATYGSNLPSVTVPTRTGYTFAGYWTESGGGGTQYYNAYGNGTKKWDIASASTLYAKWTQNTYTVTFKYMKGTGSKATSQVETPGTEAAAAPAESEVNTYFAHWFVGWDADFSCVVSNMTVNALYTESYFKIRYAPGVGATGEMEDQTIHAGVQTALTANAFVRGGYSFREWLTSIAGATRTFADEEVVQDLVGGTNVLLTFTAQWDPITYTVSYEPEGGEGLMPATSQSYDVPFQVAANGYERTGYAFASWTNAAGRVYLGGETVSNLTVTAGDVVSFWAVWTANEYSVRYEPNGAQIDAMHNMSDTDAVYDMPFALPANRFVRNGYTFNGWNTASDGTGHGFANGETVSNLATNQGEVATLHAQWAANGYTVVFDGNGGGGSITNTVMDCTYDEAYTLPQSDLAKDGCVFSGWGYGSNGFLADGATFSNLTNEAGIVVTLRAVWETTGGDIKEALDIPASQRESMIVWKSRGSWEVREYDSATDEVAPQRGTSYMTASSASGISDLSMVVTNAGTLSFWWTTTDKRSPRPLQFEFLFCYLDNQPTDASTYGDDGTWHYVEMDLTNLEGEHTIVWRLNTGSDSYTDQVAYIDHLTWTPVGSEPSSEEPTEADRPVIASARMATGDFKISLEATGAFRYVLQASDTIAPPEWSDLKSVDASAAGETVSFDGLFDPDRPRRFFRVVVEASDGAVE